ncbi:MAG TPA: ASCH domain-containing protein [Methanothrix sp.]|nr:ASCH domain-containing protein [Methanothrix sp.]
MDVLLSIKPRFVEAIIDGRKKYEFRKNKFAKTDINCAYIYSTSPIKKIIGVFKINNIIEDRPSALWEQLKDHAGISEVEFFDYFRNKKVGFALEIKEVERFENPLDPKVIIPDFVPPQSFCYMKFRIGNDDRD